MRTEAAKVEVAAHIIFGQDGNALPCQLGGWSMPETGYTWTVGKECRARIPYKGGQGNLVLELTAAPFLVVPIIHEQTLTVTVNGVAIGTERISNESTVGFVVPAAALGDSGLLEVTLSYPNAVSPAELGVNSDERTLGFALRDILVLWVPSEQPFTPHHRPPLPSHLPGGMEAAVRFCTALSPADLVQSFESLGQNWEFGLVQRAVGAEPLGLLRLADIPVHNLLRGLDLNFEGVEDPARLHVYADRKRPGGEYGVYHDVYAAEFHTGQFEGDTTPEALVAKFAPHLAILRRHFEERLGDGTHIFVLHGPGARTEAQVSPILTLLRSHGPNALLYVTEDDVIPPGSVAQERADLFHGYTRKFAPAQAPEQFDAGAWLSICANTYRLWREQGGGAAQAATAG